MNNLMTRFSRCRHGALSPCSPFNARPGRAGRLQQRAPRSSFHSSIHHPPSSIFAGRSAAFTLLELLVVMLVIVILAGIVFKAGRVLQERGKIQQAKADIARLSMALERYYTDHGSYPAVGFYTRDFEVEMGLTWTEPHTDAGGGPTLWLYLDEDCTYRRDRRAYISGWPKDRLGTIPVYKQATPGTPVPLILRYYKDPWGNNYKYYMGTSPVEQRGGYFVASAGPNGDHGQNEGPDADDIWAGTAGLGGEQIGR